MAASLVMWCWQLPCDFMKIDGWMVSMWSGSGLHCLEFDAHV